MVVPVPGVHVYGVESAYPAGLAGMKPGFVITAVNNVNVASTQEMAALMSMSKPSRVDGYYDGVPTSYVVDASNTSGYLGIASMDTQYFMSLMKSRWAPLFLMVSPATPVIAPGSPVSVFAFEDGNQKYFVAPFDGFWFVLHVLFWIFWVNIGIGLSNAIPALPFDGGYIAHEYIKPLCERVGIGKYSMHITVVLTVVLLGMLIGIILLPHLFHLGG
jgi:membrane-associated protease RseP (regulator of RpoE activity)